jgi:hypothetical protein
MVRCAGIIPVAASIASDQRRSPTFSHPVPDASEVSLIFSPVSFRRT